MKNSSKFIYNENGDESHNYRNSDSMNNPASNFNEDLFDPKKLISLLQRHVWTILFCVLISVSATYYIVNYHLLPVYQSEGTLLIKENEGALPGEGGRDDSGVGDIISRSFAFNSGNSVQRAIYLFQSWELSEEVARRLETSVELDNISQYPSFWSNYPEDSTTVSTSQLASRIRSGLDVEAVEPKGNLEVRNPNLLNVSYRSYSPEEAAGIVNLAVEVFQEKSLEQKQEIADKALTFLGGKKQEVQTQLNEAEDRLVSFQNENKLVAIDAQANNSVNSLSQLQAEKQNLEIQLESVNSSIQNYEKQMEAIKPGITKMADQQSKAIGPTIANYQQRLADLRTQRFVLLSNNPQLKDNPESEPQLKRLNQQISELENEIKSLSEDLVNEDGSFSDFSGTGDGNLAQDLSNIQRNLIQLRLDKSQYESQIESLNQRIKEAESFLDTYPDKQVKLARLETDVQRHKQLLNNIISQESEIALWQQTQNSSGTIVDRANPRFSPVAPNKILWLGFAAMMGLVLPITVLFFKKSISSIINSSEQLKAYPYPLLSVVFDHSLIKTSSWILNKNKDANSSHISDDVIFYHHNDSPIAESYRKIVNQILYTNPDSDLQSLVITSSGQGEGKTTLIVNVGAAFAEIDKKVLIIDCDFRRPAIHKLFSMDNTFGIKEVLFDGAKLSEAIKGTGIQNLFVLTSGAKPVSPAKLLASEKFKEMIKVVKPNYDIILFDTPPHGLVSDVATLLNLSDMVIVAAKFGETNENIFRNTLDELDKNDEINITLVLNSYLPEKSYDSYDIKDMHKYRYQQYYEYEKIDKI